MRKRHVIETEPYEVGLRVRINSPGHFMHGMTGEVVDRDAYSIDVRMDTVTDEMRKYDDARTGVVTLNAAKLEILQ